MGKAWEREDDFQFAFIKDEFEATFLVGGNI